MKTNPKKHAARLALLCYFPPVFFRLLVLKNILFLRTITSISKTDELHCTNQWIHMEL